MSSEISARRSNPRRVVVALAAALAVGLSLLVSAPPAAAAYSISFNPSNGKVGVAQQLTSNVNSGAIGVAPGKVDYFAGGVKVASANVNNVGAVSNANWTPGKAGSIQMYAVYTAGDNSQSATSDNNTVTIAKTGTSTTLQSPATAKIGVSVSFTANVSSGNAYTPTGTVTFLKSDGTPIQTQALSGGAASINVIMPATAQTYSIKARYNGDANANGSTSEVDQVLVTVNGNNITLTAPTTAVVGAPITLKASVVPSSSTGSMTFLLNGAVLGAQKTSNGEASIQWTPLATGTFTISANFSANGITLDGSASQQLTVTNKSTPDVITLDPVGSATPWIPGAGYPIRNGSQTTFTAATASGAAATLSVTGPCAVNGLVLTANAGSGACLLSAKSPGGGNYSPVTQQYTVTLILGIQTAQLAAPSSGRLSKRASYPLSAAGLKTNAGSTVTWRVTKGKYRCYVTTSTAGATLFTRSKRGKCVVRAYGAPVSGQWQAYKKKFVYRVR
jgi:hypothetical protein